MAKKPTNRKADRWEVMHGGPSSKVHPGSSVGQGEIMPGQSQASPYLRASGRETEPRNRRRPLRIPDQAADYKYRPFVKRFIKGRRRELKSYK